ncbi:hypothetical protein [Kribbella shirazensis]|uniref:Uncharacterized protein n=1 Tax=Kribbella shirazensis TaxID=1105143 RepID=A0A7X5VH33_9ACTN|nr:hypothetical protein [Kribbella shirazensis]NIK61119.1 hypothetical protein [Kribbella shirazensis]
MEFRPDGTLVEYAIGRGDAPEARAAGRWDATGRLARGQGGSGRIVSSTPDRLEIAWQE